MIERWGRDRMSVMEKKSPVSHGNRDGIMIPK